MSEDNTVQPSNNACESILEENIRCLICFGNVNDVSREMLLGEFGATRLWDDFARHQKEGHDREENSQ